MTHRLLPWVFRLSGTLLLAAAGTGGWWQRQPAGGATRLLMHHLSQHCPAAVAATTAMTVASGAYALDRVTSAMLLDRLSLHRTSRCTGKADDGQAWKMGR